MHRGRVISVIHCKDGSTDVLVKGLGRERDEREWITTDYGRMIQPGSSISWRNNSISAKAPWWKGSTLLINKFLGR